MTICLWIIDFLSLFLDSFEELGFGIVLVYTLISLDRPWPITLCDGLWTYDINIHLFGLINDKFIMFMISPILQTLYHLLLNTSMK